jgi:hypothetical protein
VWLGGVVFVRTGSYDAVWWLSVLFGLLSAVINLPIVENRCARPPRQPDDGNPDDERTATDGETPSAADNVPAVQPSSSSGFLAHARRHPGLRLPDRVIGFGRARVGLFPHPDVEAHGWGRDVFALALAIQMLLWARPSRWRARWRIVMGRAGAQRGAVLYALGLASMAYAATRRMLHLTAGAVIGFGLAGASFTIVIGASAS